MKQDRLGRLGRAEIKAAARRFERMVRQIAKRDSIQGTDGCERGSSASSAASGSVVCAVARGAGARQSQTEKARSPACAVIGGRAPDLRSCKTANVCVSTPSQTPTDSTTSETDRSGKILSHDSLRQEGDVKP